MSANSAPNKTHVEIAEFYDKFGKRLLRDYVHGNARLAKAIDRVCGAISKSHTRILDVGCGIGTSANQYKTRCEWVQVDGVDISPHNVSVAKALFERDGVRFSLSTMEDAPAGAPYDVVTLIDVYEHIPRTRWPAFNTTLSECLSPSGLLILTTPTPLHQAYLAKHKPEGLQVVDECVEFSDVLQLQTQLGGTLTCYEFVSVWNTHDYLHVVINRDPQFHPILSTHLPNRSLWQRISARLAYDWHLEINERRKHVKEALGVDVE